MPSERVLEMGWKSMHGDWYADDTPQPWSELWPKLVLIAIFPLTPVALLIWWLL